MKTLIYKITLPIYLWSIGFKNLDTYVESILEWEVMAGRLTDKKIHEISLKIRGLKPLD